MKLLMAYTAATICFSSVPAVMGQTPETFQPSLMKPLSANYAKPTPAQEAKALQASGLAYSAIMSLHSGNYTRAETDARQSLLLNPGDGVPAEVLAGALEAQGKDKEALQQYQIIVEHYDTQPRNLLPYAQLLLKSGQWAQAVTVYNSVLPHLPDVGSHSEAVIVHDSALMQANSRFTADSPEPAALATALHLARGMVYNATPSWAGGVPQDTEAMGEYQKALQLAPDNALTNYYYGVGWRKLAPADRAKFGTAQQAKAALQKAVKVGNANVRKAATKALKDAG